jgi:hypothetical protein
MTKLLTALCVIGSAAFAAQEANMYNCKNVGGKVNVEASYSSTSISGAPLFSVTIDKVRKSAKKISRENNSYLGKLVSFKEESTSANAGGKPLTAYSLLLPTTVMVDSSVEKFDAYVITHTDVPMSKPKTGAFGEAVVHKVECEASFVMSFK